MKTLDFSGIKNNGPLPNPQDVEVPGDIGDLLDDYVESTESMLGELEQAALAYEAGQGREGDSAAARRILHKIKGESSMVGIDQMCEFCHQAEFAFEELPEHKRPDMLLRFKDWVLAALHSMTG
jgi:HPt (histidine-containing phosphotransfer) domain-containing protein